MRRISMRFPGGKSKLFTISYDDGVKQDIRLLSLMEKYGIKGTFNLNSGRFAPRAMDYGPDVPIRRHLLSADEATKLYSSPNAEVAMHGLEHIFPNSVPTSVAMTEFITDRSSLEKMFGKIIRGFAYPYGSYDDDCVDLLRLSGIAYARTINCTNTFTIPQDWLRLYPTCHHADPHALSLIEDFITKIPQYDPLFFYMWGHSYEFDMQNNWCLIEEIFDKVSQKDDVWYCTNIEAYEYIEAFKKLIFSADGSIICNPTATDIWANIELPVTFDSNGLMPSPDTVIVKIPAGDTVKL